MVLIVFVLLTTYVIFVKSDISGLVPTSAVALLMR